MTLCLILAMALAAAPESAAGSGSATENIAQGFHALDQWHIDQAREIAEGVLHKWPNSNLAFALAGEVKMNMSDYAGAVAYFDKARETGAPEQILQTEVIARATLKATQDYQEYLGEHFILRYAPGKDAILAPYALETLEQARERIGRLLGWMPSARVVMEIYPSADVLAHVSTLTEKEIHDSGTIALCRWNRLMITSPRAVYFGYAWRDTIAHELTHLLIGGASANTVPIWLHEGIAKYVETAWRTEPGEGLSSEQQNAVREAARKNKLIPFEKMHPSMAKLKNQEETSLAFAEVFTFIEFLVQAKGWEGMREVLRLMSTGLSDEEALRQVHGRSLKALAQDWMQGLKTRAIRVNGWSAPERKVLVKGASDAPDDQLHGIKKRGRRLARAADLLYNRGRFRAAQTELQKAYQENGSALLSAKLATVALKTGDLESAQAAAESAIQGTPDLAGPNITLAEILLRRGKSVEATTTLERAISINPFDPRIYPLMMTASPRDSAQHKQAELSRAILLAEDGLDGRTEQTGGHSSVVRVESPTMFARVYVKTSSSAKDYRATGMVTPTPPFSVPSGRIFFKLVPPVGPTIYKIVDITEAKDPVQVIVVTEKRP